MNEIKTMNIDEVLKNMMICSETVNANDDNNILKRDEAEYNRLLEGSKIIPDYVDLDGLNKALSNMRENVKTANDGTILSVEYLDAYNKLIDCINDISKINDKYVSKDTAVTLEDIVENKEAVDNFYTDSDNPINFSAYGDDKDDLIEDAEPKKSAIDKIFDKAREKAKNKMTTNDDAIVEKNDMIVNSSSIDNLKIIADSDDKIADYNIKEDESPFNKLVKNDYISNNNNVSSIDVTPVELEDSTAISNIGDNLTNHLNTQYDIDTRNKILDKKSHDSLNYLQGLIDNGEAQNYGLTQEILDDSSNFRMMAMEESIKNNEKSNDDAIKKY